jgi:hypothetical protein
MFSQHELHTPLPTAQIRVSQSSDDLGLTAHSYPIHANDHVTHFNPHFQRVLAANLRYAALYINMQPKSLHHITTPRKILVSMH